MSILQRECRAGVVDLFFFIIFYNVFQIPLHLFAPATPKMRSQPHVEDGDLIIVNSRGSRRREFYSVLSM